MAYATNILELIGNTPLVEVTRLERGVCRLFLKLENQNPGGSIKDRVALESGAYYINQFANPANPLAHERTTGPEIWEQMEHDVDAVVCGVGTGGTITGLSRFFARVSPKTEIVLADPAGSILAALVNTGKAPAQV